MYGLYDIDGILRFTCSDLEACTAYAELLEINSDEYSLISFPDKSQLEVKPRWKKARRRQAMNNN